MQRLIQIIKGRLFTSFLLFFSSYLLLSLVTPRGEITITITTIITIIANITNIIITITFFTFYILLSMVNPRGENSKYVLIE